jgi:phage-related protein
MRELPIYSSATGYIATSTTKVAHLFELELARLKLVEPVASGSSIITVDDIDKGFVGQILVYPYTSGTVTSPVFLTVTAVSPLMNQIHVDAAINDGLTVNTYLYETLYDEANYPVLTEVGDTQDYKLQMWHSVFGTLCGRMLFTDLDIPVISKLSDGIFNESYAVYAPWPIEYQGTSYDTQGRMSNVEVNVANVDLRFSNIILTHEALRRRRVKIYTVYLDNAQETNLNIPIRVNSDITVLAGRADEDGNPIHGENAPFATAIFDAEEEKVQEFEGFVDNVTLTAETVTLTLLNYLDVSDMTMLPRHLYTRGRCQFVYKGSRCRFTSNLVLYSTATASDTELLVYDLEGKFPLVELRDGETSVVQIGSEQMLVTSATKLLNSRFREQEVYHGIKASSLVSLLTAMFTSFIYSLTVVRGHNNTTQATHVSQSPIDIPMCKKTFRECRLRYHERMFGGFPAVPKQQYNV